MQANITARNIKLTKDLAEYVNRKINRLTKYVRNIVNADVKLTVEKYRHIAEIIVNAEKNVFTAKEVSDDMYAAIDLVMDKLERQVIKFRERRKEHHKGRDEEAELSIFSRFWDSDSCEGMSEITAIKQIHVKPATCGQAIDDLKSQNTSFYVFLNEDTNKLNILFKRENNSFGLLELNY